MTFSVSLTRVGTLVRVPVLSGSWRLAGGQLHGLAPSDALASASFSSLRTYSIQSPLVPCGCVHGGQPVAKLHNSNSNSSQKKDGRVNISFTDRDGDVSIVRARLGDNLLEVAREYDIDLEVVDPEWFPKITDPLTEEEEDMLDLAYGLTDTSRLGCQIVITEDLDGLKLTIPMATIDARES